jgi:hypothetical protein
MIINLTNDCVTVVEGVYAQPREFEPDTFLHICNAYGDFVYGTFVDIAVKADVDFDFIKEIQNHIEVLSEVTGVFFDINAMVNTMATIWEIKNPDPFMLQYESGEFGYQDVDQALSRS